VVLGATMLIAASLSAWRREQDLYRPLARTCAAVAVVCLGIGAVRPAPLVLGVTLVSASRGRSQSRSGWPTAPTHPPSSPLRTPGPDIAT
jgi:hypothetical protein